MVWTHKGCTKNSADNGPHQVPVLVCLPCELARELLKSSIIIPILPMRTLRLEKGQEISHVLCAGY